MYCIVNYFVTFVQAEAILSKLAFCFVTFFTFFRMVLLLVYNKENDVRVHFSSLLTAVTIKILINEILWVLQFQM
jgi:hypothetical protein